MLSRREIPFKSERPPARDVRGMVNRVHCIDFALREVQNCRGG